MFDSHVKSSSVKFQVCYSMVKNCNNVVAGIIFIIELTEVFSVCLSIYNEAFLGVRVYLYKPVYSRERGNAKLREQNCQKTGKLIKHETS